MSFNVFRFPKRPFSGAQNDPMALVLGLWPQKNPSQKLPPFGAQNYHFWQWGPQKTLFWGPKLPHGFVFYFGFRPGAQNYPPLGLKIYPFWQWGPLKTLFWGP